MYGLEKTRQRVGVIKEILGGDRVLVSVTESVLWEVKGFYEDLFTSRGINEREMAFMVEFVEYMVSDSDKKMCDEEITTDEIRRAIEQLTVGKSPGIDGLTAEFYKCFSKQVVPYRYCLMKFLPDRR